VGAVAEVQHANFPPETAWRSSLDHPAKPGDDV